MEHIWPASIVRKGDTSLLYLDQFHWIGLAKAAAGRGEPEYEKLLALLRTGTAAGVLTIPLSSANYMELNGTASHRQRRDVAAVMAELSNFAVLPARTAVIRFEVEAVLDSLVGPRAVPLPSTTLVGRGFRHAFNVDSSIAPSAREVLDPLRRLRPMPDVEFEAEVALADDWAEMTMLTGPSSDDDLVALERHGFVRYAAQDGQARRAEQEQWLSDYMSGPASRWRRGRLRDVVALRYLASEAMTLLVLGLQERGAPIEELPFDRKNIRALVDSMPSADVHVSIQVAIHRNPNSVWERNDFFDLDALAVAVPYCDAVATERHRASDLRQQGCTRRFQSVVLSNLNEVLTHVDGLVQS